jgi:hypothetical protein
MKDVDLYLKVRHAVRIEGLSERAAARRFGIDPRTVNKMMKFSVPPGYVRKKPPAKPKLDPLIPVIDRILGDDKSRPKRVNRAEIAAAFGRGCGFALRRRLAAIGPRWGRTMPRSPKSPWTPIPGRIKHVPKCRAPRRPN